MVWLSFQNQTGQGGRGHPMGKWQRSGIPKRWPKAKGAIWREERGPRRGRQRNAQALTMTPAIETDGTGDSVRPYGRPCEINTKTLCIELALWSGIEANRGLAAFLPRRRWLIKSSRTSPRMTSHTSHLTCLHNYTESIKNTLLSQESTRLPWLSARTVRADRSGTTPCTTPLLKHNPLCTNPHDFGWA